MAGQIQRVTQLATTKYNNFIFFEECSLVEWTSSQNHNGLSHRLRSSQWQTKAAPLIFPSKILQRGNKEAKTLSMKAQLMIKNAYSNWSTHAISIVSPRKQLLKYWWRRRWPLKQLNWSTFKAWRASLWSRMLSFKWKRKGRRN